MKTRHTNKQVNKKQQLQCQALLHAEKFNKPDLEGELPDIVSNEIDDGWQENKTKLKKGAE